MPVNRLRTGKMPRSDIHEAFIRHVTALGPAACYSGPEDRINGDGICMHPEYAELAIYNMLDEAGVVLKLFSPVIDAEVEEGRLCAVIIREKRGLVRYRATAQIVPPGCPALSRTSTLAPRRAAATAAPSPAGPEPHTMQS